MPWPDQLVLLVAGVVAGAVGTAGGITSLVSYPALLLVGLPALAANVANLVALVVCLPGAGLASRAELAGRGRWLARWAWVPAAGSAAGSGLLLSTSPGAFERVVPFLVAAGSLVLLAQPRLDARAGGRVHGSRALAGGLLPLSVYNGYFGAGSGVMTLALMLLAADRELPRANALKNVLVGVATLASAIVLVSFDGVVWHAVVPLAAGLFVGSTIGPGVARRVPPVALRWAVALFGVGFAIQLFVSYR
ncbi:MAG: sulfite exporter TauE/SafE family protein [Acidimicrobiales bacterium]